MRQGVRQCVRADKGRSHTLNTVIPPPAMRGDALEEAEVELLYAALSPLPVTNGLEVQTVCLESLREGW